MLSPARSLNCRRLDTALSDVARLTHVDVLTACSFSRHHILANDRSTSDGRRMRRCCCCCSLEKRRRVVQQSTVAQLGACDGRNIQTRKANGETRHGCVRYWYNRRQRARCFGESKRRAARAENQESHLYSYM